MPDNMYAAYNMKSMHIVCAVVLALQQNILQNNFHLSICHINWLDFYIENIEFKHTFHLNLPVIGTFT